jgi:arginyl-tRNA synthetase
VLHARLELPPGLVERVEVAGAGFLNFHLRADWRHDAVREAREQREQFGRGEAPEGERSVLVEFVSANPTGPLTVTHGRGAALGDAIAHLLEWSGRKVSRECYVNDASSNLDRFAQSLEARYLQALGDTDARVPVDGYPDEYVAELGLSLAEEHGASLRDLPPAERLAALRDAGRDAMLRRQRETLEQFGVQFDTFCSERSLQENGRLQEVMDLLRERDLAYDLDGAFWLRAGFGNPLDRALVRSNGRATYLANDLAYHLDKFRRGFDRMIDVWGPDHQAHTGRTLAGITALGCALEPLEILVFGPVSLKIDGMAIEGDVAQRGNMPLLSSVLDAVGGPSARLLYLLKPRQAALEVDLDAAREQVSVNPAHLLERVPARIADMLDRARAEGGLPEGDVDLSPLDDEASRALLGALAEFPGTVRAAAREREPYRLARYLVSTLAMADGYCAELESDSDKTNRTARLAILDAAATVLNNARAALGLTPPEPTTG